jgi:hypothetical protein
MIRSISWAHFCTVIAALVVLYYIVVAVVFFKRKLSGAGRKSRAAGTALKSISSSQEENEDLDPGAERILPAAADSADRVGEPDLYPVANELVETIDEFIVKAGKAQMIKEEVFFGIQQLICRYPMLRLAGFKTAINNYIGIALKNNCPFGLDELEMSALWAEEKKT